MFTSLFSKIAAVVIVLLALACGYFYLDGKTAWSEAKSAQTELAAAEAREELQKQTIERLRKDAEVQEKLLDEYKRNVEEIRDSANKDLKEIEDTDFGKEANTNAAELERIINERTKRLLDNITRISQEGKK